ncbi:MAG: EF-hand domain-containing protein [Alphaproteobacteria bacterium]|nr:EF-hand domain-containing protein [Alphaproteobacteria bacterium]
MKLRIIAIAAAAAVALPGLALAEAKAPAKDPRIDLIFGRLDANKDGKITAEEIAKYRGGLFKAADKNGDGSLDSIEVAANARARMEKRLAVRFAAFDKDKNGKLTLDEMPGRRKYRMWRMDANIDGAITIEEMKKHAEKRLPRRLAFGISRLDLDGDGKLSRAEYVAGTGRLFRHFDRNRDGVVSREEVAAKFAAGGKRGGRRGMKRSWRHGGKWSQRGHGYRGMMRHHMGSRWSKGPGEGRGEFRRGN